MLDVPTREDPSRIAWEDMPKEARAAILRAALEHVAMNQSDLMRRLGVSYPAVNKWFLAKTPISWHRWLQIAHALSLSPDWRPEPKPTSTAN